MQGNQGASATMISDEVAQRVVPPMTAAFVDSRNSIGGAVDDDDV